MSDNCHKWCAKNARQLLLILAVPFLLMASVSQAQAEDQGLQFSEVDGSRIVGDLFTVYEDKQRILTLESAQELRQQGRFVPIEDFNQSVANPDSDYWVHIEVRNDTERFLWFLFLPHQRVAEMTSYVLNEGRDVQTQTTGFYVPVDMDLPSNKIPIVPMFISPGTDADIYVKLKGFYLLNLPFIIANDPVFDSWVRRDHLLFGGIIGMAVAAWFFLMATWRIVKDPAIFMLVGYVLFVTMFIGFTSGYSRDFLGYFGEGPSKLLMIYTIVGVWFFALVFGRAFLATKQTLPRVDIWMRIGIVLCVVAAIAGYFFVDAVRVALIAVANPAFIILILIAGGLGMRRQLPGAQEYFLAALAIFLGALMRNGIDIGIVPLNEFTGNAVYIGMALSTLTLSFAVSEKVRRQQKDSEGRQRAIIEASLDGIVSVDTKGRILEYNPSAETMFGYPREQAIGASIWDLLVPERSRELYQERVGAVFSRLREGDLSPGERIELPALRADGSVFPIEVSAAPARINEMEFFTAHVRDLTEEKKLEAEVEQQREALFQSEKLSALGSLLAGVAHELNNPLSIIVGRSSMMRDMANDERTEKGASKIYDAAQRCARIIRSFLAMARQRPQERERINVNEVVTASLDLIGYNLRNDSIQVETDLASDLPDTLADSDQLTQVLINLIINAQHALKAVDHERRIFISTRYMPNASAYCLEVRDNGPGIAEDVKKRVFDPFFTTKPVGSGTGLGLSVSRGMIESHGGSIDIRSSPDGGAVFVISFPRIVPEISGDAGELDGESEDNAVHSGKILIVDDEAETSDTLAEMLRTHGHEVDYAPSGIAALERLSSKTFDVILCDLRMPEMSGEDFYDELHLRYPAYATRIIFITGDQMGEQTLRVQSRKGPPVLEKTISTEDLLREINAVMSQTEKTSPEFAF